MKSKEQTKVNTKQTSLQDLKCFRRLLIVTMTKIIPQNDEKLAEHNSIESEKRRNESCLEGLKKCCAAALEGIKLTKNTNIDYDRLNDKSSSI